MSSSDEPQKETSGEQPRIFREPSESTPTGDPTRSAGTDDTPTKIIRRHPIAETDEPLSDDTRTSILRPQPTSLEPTDQDEQATGIIRPAPIDIPGPPKPPTNTTAVAASAVSIINGWATSVVATGLITGWWRTDRLFCVGVGFLTAVFGASTIAGVAALLLRRRVGILLTVVAAVLALLIFAGLFIAGAHMAGVVYAFPALAIAAIVLSLVQATWRWTKPG